MIKLFKRKTSVLDRLRADLGEIELPCFPASVMKVMELLREAEATTSEIVSHVELDPGLTSRVLKMVNSAGYGLSARVESVRHAVGLLGRSRLEALVVSVAVRQSIPAVHARGFGQAEFWRDSARRASVARALSQRLHPAAKEEAFTAALLQDMGVPVLVAARGDDYGDVYARWGKEGGTPLVEMEYAAFQCDHARIGAALARHWNLPAYLVEAIETHHMGDSADQPATAAIRLVADLRHGAEREHISMVARRCADVYGAAKDDLEEHLLRALENAADLSE